MSSKFSAILAGVSVLAGILTLIFSPGTGRIPLGTMSLIIGLGFGVRYLRQTRTSY